MRGRVRVGAWWARFGPERDTVDELSGPVVLARHGSADQQTVLRRTGADFEIISNGVFLMDTRNGASERLLVDRALAGCPAARPAVLIGGLGVGFSLAAAVAHERVAAVEVVEICPPLPGWCATHLAHIAGPALADPRVRVTVGDLLRVLPGRAGRFDVVCLDTDNGPEWTVTPGNRALYQDAGLALVRAVLRPAGVAAFWSAHRSDPFAGRLAAQFSTVDTVPVPVPRGEPDVVYLAYR